MGQGSRRRPCPPTPLARLLLCPPYSTDLRPHRVPLAEWDTAGLGSLVHISSCVLLPRDPGILLFLPLWLQVPISHLPFSPG